MPSEPFSLSTGDPRAGGEPLPRRVGSKLMGLRRARRRVRPDLRDADFARRAAVADLAEGIAHDLKNRLTVVAASVQLARDGCPPDLQELLDRAWRSAMRAARLLDDMLRYTRGAAAAEGDADACEALETAIAGAWDYCRARRVQLEMRFGSGLPRVAASPPALRVLLLHLLRWAADQTPADCRLVVAATAGQGGISVSLRVLAPDGQELSLAPGHGGLPADLAALIALTGVVLSRDASGLRVWLSAAGDAAVQSAAD